MAAWNTGVLPSTKLGFKFLINADVFTERWLHASSASKSLTTEIHDEAGSSLLRHLQLLRHVSLLFRISKTPGFFLRPCSGARLKKCHRLLLSSKQKSTLFPGSTLAQLMCPDKCYFMYKVFTIKQEGEGETLKSTIK